MTASTVDSASLRMTSAAGRAAVKDEARQTATINLLTIDLVLCVMTQKLAVIADIEVPLLVHLCFVAFMMLRGMYEISIPRLLLFSAFAIWALICHAFFSTQPFSLNSLLLVLGIYFLYVLMAPLDRAHYVKFMNRFVVLATIATGLCFSDWILQVVGLGKPNLELFVPSQFLFQAYDYHAPLVWGQPLIRPNGFFFLERSHLAQFIAMGIIAEIIYRRRLWLIALMLAGVFSTVSGTGTILLALTAPFLLYRLNWRILAGLAAAGVIAIAVMPLAGIGGGPLDMLMGRTEEFGSQGTSGYNRFVLPAKRLAEAWSNPQTVLTGDGAGTMPKNTGIADSGAGLAWPPYAKLGEEYGIIGLALWTVFFCFCVFNRGIPAALCWIVFLQLHLSGGTLAVPIHSLSCLILVVNFRITDLEPEEKRGAFRRPRVRGPTRVAAAPDAPASA